MAYNIEIKNVGKDACLFHVFGDDNLRRPAKFDNWNDAKECVKMLSMVRRDSALEWIRVVKEKGN